MDNISVEYCQRGFQTIVQAQNLENYFQAMAFQAAKNVYGAGYTVSRVHMDFHARGNVIVSIFEKFRGEEEIIDVFDFKAEDFISVDNLTECLKKKNADQITLQEKMQDELAAKADDENTKERYGI